MRNTTVFTKNFYARNFFHKKIKKIFFYRPPLILLLGAFCLPNGEFWSQAADFGTKMLEKKLRIRTYACLNYGAKIALAMSKSSMTQKVNDRRQGAGPIAAAGSGGPADGEHIENVYTFSLIFSFW